MKVSVLLTRALPISLLVSVAVSGAAQQPSAAPMAIPVEPIAAILNAFSSHPVVALGEGAHGNEQGHAFRLALIRSPGFAAAVNDIVVEFGNALYQDVIDRFARGDDVPYDSLRAVWQDTTQPNAVWDGAIYEEFFRAVRAVNADLPRDRQVRVLLGDPPVDWSRANTPQGLADVNRWMDQRDAYPAELVEREVLARGRRALLIWGDAHLMRNESFTLVGRLEARTSVRVFAISTNTSSDLPTIQSNATSWPVPSLVPVAGTILGKAALRAYLPLGPPPAPGDKSVQIENALDAILYLGPRSAITMAPFPVALCADRAYVEMRLTRLALFPQLKGVADRFKRACASVDPR
jgi:hypothetical protein